MTNRPHMLRFQRSLSRRVQGDKQFWQDRGRSYRTLPGPTLVNALCGHSENLPCNCLCHSMIMWFVGWSSEFRSRGPVLFAASNFKRPGETQLIRGLFRWVSG